MSNSSGQMSSPIRVLIVDDQAAVRTGLKFFLLAFEDLEWVGEAVNGEQAVSLCSELEPNVVLMDLAMSVMDGVSATREIHQRWPQIKVIILISFTEKEAVQEALEVGASNYLLKNVSADELVEAIRTAHTVCSTEAFLPSAFGPNAACSSGRPCDLVI